MRQINKKKEKKVKNACAFLVLEIQSKVRVLGKLWLVLMTEDNGHYTVAQN